MQRPMSIANEKLFHELAGFLEAYSTLHLKISRQDPIHPSNVLEEIVAKFGRSKALQGLRQAVNDAIEETAHLSWQELSELDEMLKESGVVTISALRKRYWRRYKQLISQRTIKTETDYYLAVGVLNDLSAIEDAGERAILAKLVAEFEERQTAI